MYTYLYPNCIQISIYILYMNHTSSAMPDSSSLSVSSPTALKCASQSCPNMVRSVSTTTRCAADNTHRAGNSTTHVLVWTTETPKTFTL